MEDTSDGGYVGSFKNKNVVLPGQKKKTQS